MRWKIEKMGRNGKWKLEKIRELINKGVKGLAKGRGVPNYHPSLTVRWWCTYLMSQSLLAAFYCLHSPESKLTNLTLPFLFSFSFFLFTNYAVVNSRFFFFFFFLGDNLVNANFLSMKWLFADCCLSAYLFHLLFFFFVIWKE